MRMNECHRCMHNGKKSTECLKCFGGETYDYPFNRYIVESYDPPTNDTSGSG